MTFFVIDQRQLALLFFFCFFFCSVSTLKQQFSFRHVAPFMNHYYYRIRADMSLLLPIKATCLAQDQQYEMLQSLVCSTGYRTHDLLPSGRSTVPNDIAVGLSDRLPDLHDLLPSGRSTVPNDIVSGLNDRLPNPRSTAQMRINSTKCYSLQFDRPATKLTTCYFSKHATEAVNVPSGWSILFHWCSSVYQNCVLYCLFELAFK